MAKKKTVAKAKTKKRTRKAALSTAMGIKVFKGDKRLSQRTLKMFDPNTFIQGIVDDTRGHIYKAAGFIVDEVESVIDSLDVVVEEAIDSALENPAGTFAISMKKNQQSLNKITKKSEAILTDTTFMKKLMTKKFKEWDLKFDQMGSGAGGGFGFGIPDIPDKDGRKKNNKGGGRKPPKSGPKSRFSLKGVAKGLGALASRLAVPLMAAGATHYLDTNEAVAGNSTIGAWVNRNVPGAAWLDNKAYELSGGYVGTSKDDKRGLSSTIEFPVLDNPLKDASPGLLSRYHLRKGTISVSAFALGAMQQYEKTPGFDATEFYNALAAGVFGKKPTKSQLIDTMKNDVPAMAADVSGGTAAVASVGGGLNRDNTMVPLGGTSPYSVSGTGSDSVYARSSDAAGGSAYQNTPNYSTDQAIKPYNPTSTNPDSVAAGGDSAAQSKRQANMVVDWNQVQKKTGNAALRPDLQPGQIPAPPSSFTASGDLGPGKLYPRMPRQNVSDAIERAAKDLNVDPRILWAKGAVESGFQPNARAKGSSATGLGQIINGTWDEIAKYPEAKKYGITADRTGRYDPYKSAVASMLYSKHNMEKLKKQGLITDEMLAKNPGLYYVPHNLGPDGARRFLQGLKNNPDAPVTQSLKGKEVSNNPSIYAPGGRLLTYRQALANIENKTPFGQGYRLRQKLGEEGTLSNPAADATMNSVASVDVPMVDRNNLNVHRPVSVAAREPSEAMRRSSIAAREPADRSDPNVFANYMDPSTQTPSSTNTTVAKKNWDGPSWYPNKDRQSVANNVQPYTPPKALSASMWGAQQDIQKVKSNDYMKRDKIVAAQDQVKNDAVLGIGKDLLFPEKKATVNRQLNSLIRKDQAFDRKASEATLSGSVVERAYNDVMKMVSNTMKDIMPSAEKVVPPAKRADDAQKEIDEQTSNSSAKGDAEKPIQSTKNDQPVKSRQADPKTAAAKPDQVPAHPKPPVAYAASTNPKRDEIEATPTIENNPAVGGGGGW